MIANPTYKGIAYYGKRKRKVTETRDGKRVEYVRQDEEQWIPIPCPPIVSEEIWERCNQRKSENRARLSGKGRG